MFGKRILILIPHPDDEVVACAAAIARARAQGARVFGVNLSHGCLAKQTMWWWERGLYQERVDRRVAESVEVAEFLGIKMVAGNVTRAAREIWPDLQTVYGEVMQAMQQCAPDMIWVSAYEGGNPDHDAMNAVASTIKNVPVFEIAEYNFIHGIPHSNAFLAVKGNEIVLNLTEGEQVMKRAALRLYESEQKNLVDIDVRYESFRPLAQYDYAKRPHEGKLWYERFQWVLFRHPRVDFTRGETVSKAIMEFLGKT
ncbi:MAG: PIG-L family deacetylase [Alphaproteobacteria bacterium]|nr:PIG-L family deacetylase [Alphaproteobacteria bacterium]